MVGLAELHEIPGEHASLCADNGGHFRIVTHELIASLPAGLRLRVIRVPAGIRRCSVPVSEAPWARVDDWVSARYTDIDILRYRFKTGGWWWAFSAGHGYDRLGVIWVVGGELERISGVHYGNGDMHIGARDGGGAFTNGEHKLNEER